MYGEIIGDYSGDFCRGLSKVGSSYSIFEGKDLVVDFWVDLPGFGMTNVLNVLGN